MNLNELSPALGSKTARKRVGRGIGSGLGKTCGRGHKGQKARSGGYHKINFEGGQMPIQRRLPKMGFKSRVSKFSQEITLNDVAKLSDDVITIDLLKQNNLVKSHILKVKLINTGELDKAITLKGINLTKGAKACVEKLGGKVE